MANIIQYLKCNFGLLQIYSIKTKLNIVPVLILYITYWYNQKNDDDIKKKIKIKCGIRLNLFLYYF